MPPYCLLPIILLPPQPRKKKLDFQRHYTTHFLTIHLIMQRTLTAKQIPPNPVGSWLDDRRDKADSAIITTSKYGKKKNKKTKKLENCQISVEVMANLLWSSSYFSQEKEVKGLLTQEI